METDFLISKQKKKKYQLPSHSNSISFSCCFDFPPNIL